MTLREIYKTQASFRGKEKPIEEYQGPALFWCDMFHICDRHGNVVLDLYGPDMTSALLKKYAEYHEFEGRSSFVGGDYIHHYYLKPPAREEAKP